MLGGLVAGLIAGSVSAAIAVIALPGVWRGRDAHKAHFWVRGEGGQWAHVSDMHYVEDTSLQNARDARAEQVARSLKPGSGWPLAAAVAECGFCTPLA